jgi:N-acetylneuraminate synthase
MTNPIKIVAEISGNHNGSLARAHSIIEACAGAGVSAIKIQTYTADTITLDVDSEAFRISDDHALWGARTLHSLYSEAYTPWEWHEPIFTHCRELGVIPFSTPFDETAVEFLEKLDCPIYKIASLEIVDIPLIRMASGTKKPLIISTGAASLDEISNAVDAARSAGAIDLTLLVCTSSYPANPNEANLLRMDSLRELFGVKVGLSDHTLGSAVSIAAAALGAEVIEKHVTLSRSDGGVDSAFSIEPQELEQLVSDVKDASDALGSATAWRTESEAESIRLRPSLYFAEDVKAGEVVTGVNVRSVRPSGGLPPVDIDNIMGKRVVKDAQLGDPTSWEMFEI